MRLRQSSPGGRPRGRVLRRDVRRPRPPPRRARGPARQPRPGAGPGPAPRPGVGAAARGQGAPFLRRTAGGAAVTDADKAAARGPALAAADPGVLRRGRWPWYNGRGEGRSMPLNPQRVRFVEGVVRTGNQTEAYMTAYGVTDRNVAKAAASRLLTDVNVQEAVNAGRAAKASAVQEETNIDAARLTAALWKKHEEAANARQYSAAVRAL